MRQVVIFAFMALGYLALGFEVREIQVTGQDNAQVIFVGQVPSAPQNLRVNENSLEFAFPATYLSDRKSEKLEILSPHALIKRVTLVQGSENALKGKIVLNGSMEGIKERLHWDTSSQNLILRIDYPAKNGAALKLLQEEQTPLLASAAGKATEQAHSHRTLFVLMTFVFVALALGMVVLFRVLKKKGSLKGPRKYLIEQLGYCPLGTKSGVSLLKVGTEFVLVGITPNQISMLSQLPKLQEQYAEETGFERSVFKEAVSQEVQRLR